MKKINVIKTCLIIELPLLFSFIIFSFFKPIDIVGKSFLVDIAYGILAASFLLAFNYILFFSPLSRIKSLEELHYFKDIIINPLIKKLTLIDGFIISILAGISEELFFRGILQNEFGIIIASSTFALAHFGTKILKFKVTGFIYLLAGFYLGFLYYFSNSLLCSMTCHFLYDFIAIYYIKKKNC